MVSTSTNTEAGLWSNFNHVVDAVSDNDAFLIDGSEKISYKQLRETTLRVASYLQTQGVLVNSRVGIKADDPLIVTCFTLACDLLGAHIIIFNINQSAHDIDKCIKDANLNFAIIGSSPTNTLFTERLKSLDAVRIIHWSNQVSNWEEQLESYEQLKPPSRKSANDLTFISCETNRNSIYINKINMQSMFENALQTAKILQINCFTKVMHSQKWSNRLGFFTLIHCFCLEGGTAILSSKSSFGNQIKNIVHTTLYIGTAHEYMRIIDEKLLDKINKKELPDQNLVSCGSFPPDYQRDYFNLTGSKVRFVYGRSSVGNIVFSAIDAEKPLMNEYSRFSSDIEIQVEELDNKIFPDPLFPDSRNVGKLSYASKHTGNIFSDCDYGVINERGELIYYGTEKMFNTIHGLTVTDYQAEYCLFRMDQVRDCTVFSLPHPEKELALCALVVVKQGSTDVFPEIMKSSMFQYLSSHKVPHKIIFVGKIRRNSWGFVDKIFYQSHYHDIFTL